MHAASFCRGDIQRRVADAEQKAFSEACRQFKCNAVGRTDFDIGDYVLLHDEAADKLAGPWFLSMTMRRMIASGSTLEGG